MKLEKIRLLIFNQTEDYRQALSLGKLNDHHLQALEAMTTWGFQVQEIGVMGAQSNLPYNEVLDTGLRVIGSGMPADMNPSDLLKLVADFCPTHLVVQVPQPEIFRWAMRNQIACIALFNQAFMTLTLQQRWQNYQFSKLLNHSQIDWVGSQGLPACQSLQSIGVNPQKLIPWSWARPESAPPAESKPLRSQLNPLNLLYVGPVVSTKGVGDLLIATAQLQSLGKQVHLKIVGQGETARFTAQARRLRIADSIEFIEQSPNNTISPLLRSADVLVIPNRHEYPETTAVSSLIYSSLAAHTPIVASDHPMLTSRLAHGLNALIFPAGNARALAQQINRLVSQSRLYTRLSDASPTPSTLAPLPVTWAALIERWLHSGSQDRLWLKEHTLASNKYTQTISTLPLPIQRSA